MGSDRFDVLREQVRGQVIEEGDADYEAARQVYNGMIDRRPAAVLRVSQAADVIAAVRFARGLGIDVAVRGGGHSAPGFGTVDGGLVLDFSARRGVRVDPAARTARVEAGATWADYNHATHAFGLASTGGIVGSTGVTGLTLGGGIGYLARKYGLSCDNLIGADVVLADGSFVTASDAENVDLFWALRGGSGNFGVVTSLEFRLHPVDMVHVGVIFFDAATGADVGAAYREWIATEPEEIGAFLGFHRGPPVPFLPEQWHGRPVTVIAGMWTGDPDAGPAHWPDPSENERNIAWVRDYWTALHEYSEPGGYLNFQDADDQVRIEDTLGSNYARLAELKAKYDPDNFFHINQNIRPAPPAEAQEAREPAKIPAELQAQMDAAPQEQSGAGSGATPPEAAPTS